MTHEFKINKLVLIVSESAFLTVIIWHSEYFTYSHDHLKAWHNQYISGMKETGGVYTKQ